MGVLKLQDDLGERISGTSVTSANDNLLTGAERRDSQPTTIVTEPGGCGREGHESCRSLSPTPETSSHLQHHYHQQQQQSELSY